MKKSLLGLVAIGALFAVPAITPAMAADMPSKAPPPAAPLWTGWYIGANVGYSFGRATTDLAIANVTLPAGTDFTHSDASSLDGVIGGGQIGYNWQVSPNWVWGLEADWQAASESGSQNFSDPYSFGFGAATFTTNYNTKIEWFGTARGRLGYVWDGLMLYGTGGLAYGEVKASWTATDSGISLGQPFGATDASSASRLNVGWTAGAGVEGALGRNWSWKLEYLYLDLGSINFSAIGPFSNGGVNPELITAHDHFTDNIVRIGLNYKLW